MPSEMVSQLEKAYAAGEMEELKSSILPFLRKHRNKLIEFMEEFQKVEGHCALEVMIKIFIIQFNMPFCMRQYMTQQSTIIKKQIEEERCDDENRQAVAAAWVRQKAEDHRSHSMFRQVFCFEKAKHELLPVLQAELATDAGYFWTAGPCAEPPGNPSLRSAFPD